jgi:hypothetical protein
MSSTLFIIFWFILQIIYGYLQLGGVAFFAHVGGFLGGLALVYYLGRDVAHIGNGINIHILILTPGNNIRNAPKTPLIAPEAPKAGMPKLSMPITRDIDV